MAHYYIQIDDDDAAASAAVAGMVTRVVATYPAQVLVTADPAQIGALEAADYLVDPAPDIDALMLPNVTIDTDVPAPSPPSGWEPSVGTGYWILVCDGPLLPQWTTAIAGAGAVIHGALATHALLVEMDAATATTVAGLEGVRWVGRYEPIYKIGHRLADQASPVPSSGLATLAGADGSGTGAPGDRIQIRIDVHPGADAATPAGIVTGAGGTVDKAGSRSLIASVPRSLLPALAREEACALIGPFDAPELDLDVARTITASQTAIDRHGLTGAGEIVAVADTGLDRGLDNETLLDDFKDYDGVGGGRVRRGYTPNECDPTLVGTPFARTLWSDPSGHGTHVAGIVLGNGRLSNNRSVQGLAYGANLVMLSLRDSGNPAALPLLDPKLRGIPADLNALFRLAYDNDGARVQNNSWGSGSTSSYVADSREIDEFVWKHPDMALVFTAGNSGTDAAQAPSGVVDFQSLRDEGSAKNNITVGSGENNKPFINGTWGGHPTKGPLFPNAPITGDRISDNPQQVAATSSRGPTMAGAAVDRLKPDVIAPGVSIYASLSQLAPVPPASGFYGPYVNGTPYVYKGGTSMAAPHVTGLLALIREYLRTVRKYADPLNPDIRRRRPSAALLKALLVHGAQPVAGTYPGSAITNGPPHPSCHQGYGLVNLRATLFSHATSGAVPAALQSWLPRRTLYLDDPARTLNAYPPGDPSRRVNHAVQVNLANNSVPLRVTLAWTDYYGPAGANGALINRLRLRVTRLSDGRVFNVTTPANAGPAGFNVRRNNVQQIDIPVAQLQAGLHRIDVRAAAVSSAVSSGGASLGEEQDFALVISGAIDRSDQAVPGTLANLPDIAFVDLEPNAGVALHDGLAPTPERPAHNPGSPDILISTDQDPSTATQSDPIVAGTQYFIHIRVRNLGWANATATAVRIYLADPATPMAFPGDWSSDGFTVGDTPTNLSTIDVPGRGQAFAGPFKWTPSTDKEWVVLFVRAEQADDPIVSEGDPRLDNNITRRDLHVLDATDSVPEEPGFWGNLWFWIISGFGSPRNVRLRILMLYEDLVDGQVKPMPAGVTVQIWDADAVNDDLIDNARTRSSAHPEGGPTTVIDHTINTYEGGERSPDLYLRVLEPEGDAFSDFRRRSYFVSGAPYWMSNLREEADGGFFRESFAGDSLGVSGVVSVIMRPSGIRVQARLEMYDHVFNRFEPLPEGIEVVLEDSKNGAPTPILARATTDENGEIRAVIQQRTDHRPSIYFTIDKDADNPSFSFIDYFSDNDSWSSRGRTVEVVAEDGTVTTRSGHFESWADPRLVDSDALLRLRLRPPGILAHLKFEYFDREAGGHRPVPPGTTLQAWIDGGHSPLIEGMVGRDGRAEISVPKNGAERISFSVKLVMNRTLVDQPDPVIGPEVEVRQGGSPIEWDTRNLNDIAGSNGLFTDIEDVVGTVAAPLTFRIGTGMGDADVTLAAPYILRVIGDLHNWLRERVPQGWSGQAVRVTLGATAGQGSSFGPLASYLTINTGHTAPAARQLDSGAPQPDHWNRIAIAHQFGHTVLEEVLQRLIDPAVAIANHNAYDGSGEVTAARAFAEGWCDYIAFAHLAQKTSPTATVSAGGWTARGAGSLWAAVGGDAPDEDSWIACAINPANDTVELRVGALSDPIMSAGHLVRVRHRVNEAGRRVELTVKLFAGGNEIAAWSQEVNSTDWQTSAHTLTALQSDRIAAYGNLRVKLVATGTTGHNRQVLVSWIHLEAPHRRRPDSAGTGWRGTDNDGADSHAETVPAAVAQILWSIDKEIVAKDAAAIESDTNRTRFRELIWTRVSALAFNEPQQIPIELYRGMQGVALPALLQPFAHEQQLRNEIREIYERSGLVFCRGRVQAIAQQQAQSAAPARNEVWRLTLAPVDIARLHPGAMVRIASYQVEASRTGTTNFLLLDSFIDAAVLDQRATLDIDIGLARNNGLVSTGNSYDLRVVATDEFGGRDSFADDFTGNSDTGGHGATSSATWLGARLATIQAGPNAVP